jgi:hypothetical protein
MNTPAMNSSKFREVLKCGDRAKRRHRFWSIVISFKAAWPVLRSNTAEGGRSVSRRSPNHFGDNTLMP